MLLLFAIALATAVGAPIVLREESGVSEGRADSRVLTTGASQDNALRPPWQVRALLVVLGLACWHLTQRVLGERPERSRDQTEQVGWFLGRQDALLRLCQPVNRFLHAHPRWANALLVFSSALIDGLGLFLFVWSVAGPSIRPFLGLCILFGLRQLCQVLTALPPPDGSIWRNPGFPSLLVTYDVCNDLFFSGHTALAVYGAVELASLGSSWLLATALAIAVFEIVVVLVLRAHYTMDIFAGLMTALYVATIAAWLASPCDRALARAFAAQAEPRLHSGRQAVGPQARKMVELRADIE